MDKGFSPILAMLLLRIQTTLYIPPALLDQPALLDCIGDEGSMSVH